MAEFEHIDGISFRDSNEDFTMENPFRKIEPHVKTKKASTYVPPNKIINRLIVCLFAMCLLWMTSLQICTSIVNIFIAIPTFSSVVDQCTLAYNFMSEEQQSYVICVDIQLKACSRNLQSSYTSELGRVSANQAANDAFLSSYTSLVNNCSSSFTSAKAALSAWTNVNGIYFPVPYQETCTGQQKEEVLSLLGDTSSSSNSIYATMVEYTQSSDNTVSHLATYSVALNQYNTEYLNNKTRAMQSLAKKIVNDVSLPHISLINVSLHVPMSNLMNNVVACVSLSNSSGPCVGLKYSNRALFDSYRYSVNAVQGQIANTFTILTSQIAALNSEIQTAVTNANNFYQSVAGAQGIINWVVRNLNGAGSFSALCGKSTPNWCTFSESDWYVGWYFPQYFPKAISVPDGGYFWNQVDQVVVTAQSQISQLASNLTTSVTAMVKDIESAIASADFTPDDYNPPRYEYAGNTSSETSTQTSRSQTFLTAVQDILSQTVNSSSYKASLSVDFNATASTSQSLLSTFTTSWSSFTIGGFNLSLLLESILTIKGLFFLFDYLYRIFQTVRLLSKFWSKGVVHLPKADVRSNKDDFHSPILPYIGYFLQLLPFIWLQLLMFIFLVAVIAWSIASILVPEYNSYMSACVYHTSNSTFLSRGMYVAAYNYAAMDGNADITKGVVAYNVLTTSYCTTNSASSLYTYNNLVKSMVSKNQTLQGLISSHDQITSCVNMTSMDHHFIGACCSQAAYRSRWTGGAACDSSPLQCPVSDSVHGSVYAPPSTYLSTHGYCQHNSTALLHFQTNPKDGTLALSNSLGSVHDAVFQCSALPSCKVTCSGPDAGLLEIVTKSCSCMTEWYVNGYILQISIALITYILMNVSRSLICMGLVKINWKTLTPKIFEFTANCDRNGAFLTVQAREVVTDEEDPIGKEEKDEKDTIDSEMEEHVTVAEKKQFDLEAALQKDLQQKIRFFVWKGYCFVAVGLLINLPWMYLLYIMKRNMAYKP